MISNRMARAITNRGKFSRTLTLEVSIGEGTHVSGVRLVVLKTANLTSEITMANLMF